VLAATAVAVQISVVAMHSWAVTALKEIAKVVTCVQIQAATLLAHGLAAALAVLATGQVKACTVHRVAGVAVVAPE